MINASSNNVTASPSSPPNQVSHLPSRSFRPTIFPKSYAPSRIPTITPTRNPSLRPTVIQKKCPSQIPSFIPSLSQSAPSLYIPLTLNSIPPSPFPSSSTSSSLTLILPASDYRPKLVLGNREEGTEEKVEKESERSKGREIVLETGDHMETNESSLLHEIQQHKVGERNVDLVEVESSYNDDSTMDTLFASNNCFEGKDDEESPSVLSLITSLKQMDTNINDFEDLEDPSSTSLDSQKLIEMFDSD
eukprot:gene8605-9311_t